MIEQLRIVEIELFSFCNRKCYWCPNKDIDRTFFEYLDRTLFVNLLAELRAHDFNGVFSFSRYNEPFSDIETLFEAIRVIKTFFPHNTIQRKDDDFILTSPNGSQYKLSVDDTGALSAVLVE